MEHIRKSRMHDFEWENEVGNALFDYDSTTLVVVFIFVTSKVTTSASTARTFDIPFYFSSNEWRFLLKILTFLRSFWSKCR